MFKRVASTTLLAAGLFAFPGAKITCDPLPCPECDPWRSTIETTVNVADMRTCDPLPCPECDPWRSEQEIVKSADRG